MPAAFATRLLRWYATQQRPLPWRTTRNPYLIWVAEIMLQQTQVTTVIPYYHHWRKRFPTLQALAAAPLSAVLTCWEGLGYYARARNLHRAAQIVRDEYHGRLPRSSAALRALPGIGAYTAAAVASIAFGEAAAALDGNIQRVLARVFDIRAEVKSTAGRRQLQTLADSLVPAGRAGDYNQALMDLGASLCTPRAPACLQCPVQFMCQAQAQGTQLERPVIRRRGPRPRRIQVAGLIRKNGRLLIVQRPLDELLGGLWRFPGGERRGRERWAAVLPRLAREHWGGALQVETRRGSVSTTFSHYHLTLHVFTGRWLSGTLPPAARWVRPADLHRYPMGKADRQIARSL